MFDFKDHSFLVTGAGGDIGLGIAQAFHQTGAPVALGDRHQAGLARASERLGGSERVFTHPVDVRDGRSVADFVQATECAIGPVTVAVANAGVFPNSPILDMTTEPPTRDVERLREPATA
jgi:3-oxoacyl-[acyl-carrier protein] reductase